MEYEVLFLILPIIFLVAVSIQFDTNTQQDKSEAKDAQAQVEEHAVPEDSGQIDAGNRDQHARGSGGRWGGRQAFARGAVVVRAE